MHYRYGRMRTKNASDIEQQATANSKRKRTASNSEQQAAARGGYQRQGCLPAAREDYKRQAPGEVTSDKLQATRFSYLLVRVTLETIFVFFLLIVHLQDYRLLFRNV